MTKSKAKKTEDLEQQLGELTLDLQRTRADFENYRKRVESEKQSAQKNGEMKTVTKLLLSKKAPLSIDMQKAVLSDQSVIKDVTAEQFDYIDNQPSDPVMLLPVDDTLFATLKENISTGEISVESVLNGNYDLTPEQRAEIESL